MYNGSHAKANNKPRIRMNKLAILFIAVVMLIGAVVGSTVAFLVTKTAPVENKFTYASVSCTVSESFNGTTKEKVQIQNTGTTDAYIRATYVVTWRDMSGNVVPSVPEGYTYTLTENPDGKWKQIGDYFYYPTPVEPTEPNNSTLGSLLNCTVTHPDNPEYVLHVEILASAIQSTPEDAVTEAWGVTPSNWN